MSCSEASWRMLGLSFAGWNAAISGLLAGIAAYGATLRR
ncbi:MAG TPA: disulfide bond formation protein B [Xanthobacteraceae bacterium]